MPTAPRRRRRVAVVVAALAFVVVVVCLVGTAATSGENPLFLRIVVPAVLVFALALPFTGIGRSQAKDDRPER